MAGLPTVQAFPAAPSLETHLMELEILRHGTELYLGAFIGFQKMKVLGTSDSDSDPESPLNP